MRNFWPTALQRAERQAKNDPFYGILHGADEKPSLQHILPNLVCSGQESALKLQNLRRPRSLVIILSCTLSSFLEAACCQERSTSATNTCCTTHTFRQEIMRGCAGSPDNILDSPLGVGLSTFVQYHNGTIHLAPLERLASNRISRWS